MSGSSGGVLVGYSLQIGKSKSMCVFRMCLMDLASRMDLKAIGITSILFFYSENNYVELSAAAKGLTEKLVFSEEIKEEWDDPADDWFKKSYKEDYDFGRQTHQFTAEKWIGWLHDYQKEMHPELVDYNPGKSYVNQHTNASTDNKNPINDNPPLPAGLIDTKVIVRDFPYLQYPDRMAAEALEKKILKKKNSYSFLEDSESLAEHERQEKLNKSTKTDYTKPVEEKLANKKFRSYLVLGDTTGSVRFASLDRLFQEIAIEIVNTKIYHDKRCMDFKMSLRRKDNISLSKNLDAILNRDHPETSVKKCPIHFWWNYIEICSMKPHRNAVNKLMKIREMEGFVSTSTDKSIQFFSLNGDHWGSINLVNFKKRYWNFPYDWVGLKITELQNVYNLMEKLDVKMAHAQTNRKIKNAVDVKQYQITHRDRHL